MGKQRKKPKKQKRSEKSWRKQKRKSKMQQDQEKEVQRRLTLEWEMYRMPEGKWPRQKNNWKGSKYHSFTYRANKNKFHLCHLSLNQNCYNFFLVISVQIHVSALLDTKFQLHDRQIN